MNETNGNNAMNGNSISNTSTGNGNKKFELLPKESIKYIADQNGFENLTEEAILLLSSDVSFRVREVVHNSIQFMRQSKRRRLTTTHVNRALRAADCEPVFGFEANPSPIEAVYVKDANVFVVDDPIVDLNEEMIKILNEKRSTKVFENDIQLTVEWLSVNGKQNSNEDNSVVCSEELEDYYQNVVKAILGNDNHLFAIALKDLSTNCRITPVLPKLINFIMNGIKRLSHDISQLKRFLNTIECLFKNQSLFLSFESYLNGLIQSILYCIIEPLNPMSDHWTLRDSASHLLISVLNEWFTPFIGKDLKSQTLNSLCDCLLDSSKSFGCHYGAIKAFQSMGYDVIVDHLYPILNEYIDSHLLPSITANQRTVDFTDSQNRTDGLKVFGELLFIAELIALRMRSLLMSDNFKINFDFEVYSKLSDIFGDSLYARLPIAFEKIRHRFHSETTQKVSKRETNLFETPETQQTGEQLLDVFYDAPTHFEEMRSELSANLEEDISCDDNSVLSDKEMAATDVLQIKSTIDDPTLGIKLTFKKLKRDEKRLDAIDNRKSRTTKSSLPLNCEPIFDYISLKQTSIRFNISGFRNRPLLERLTEPSDYYPSDWFVLTMTHPNQYGLRRKCKIQKNQSLLSLYSCDLLNVL